MTTALDKLKDRLVVEWDEADKTTKEEVKADYEAIPSIREIGMEDYLEKLNKWYAKYNYTEQELIHKTSEEIHKANVKAADKMINNLVQRVEKKIGTVTDYSGVYTSSDNEGFAILNGWFKGEKGSCEVQSIRAGGYNIQKRHIRVLVK